MKDNNCNNVCGSLLGETIIEETIKIGDKLNEIMSASEEQKNIYTHLMDIRNQYEKSKKTPSS